MPLSYNLPKIKDIKNFATQENLDDWLPNLFGNEYNDNIFPITPDGDLKEGFEFAKDLYGFSDFGITLKRYYLFLYCLKTNPFLFEEINKVIDFDNDQFLYTPDLSSYLKAIQTNEIKNLINSSLTIELVKKYAVAKGLDLNPERLSDYLDIAKTEDFVENVAKTLNSVTYESVIKHTLYKSLKDSGFNFAESKSNGWIDKAALLGVGEFQYFIDIEGGPDNKSYPVVCVLTKRINVDTKENILKQSNKFVSNIFGRNVNNNCLARIIGEPGQFEDNYKSIPNLKSRKGNEFYYNSICVVYDLSRIFFSSEKERNFDVQAMFEIALGFATKYFIEINNIDELQSRKESLSVALETAFDENSLSQVQYKILSADKHATEIFSRINIQKKDQVKASISEPIGISKQKITNAFSEYVDSFISSYKSNRLDNLYLSNFSNIDSKIIIHFDSFLNLLGVSCVPLEKKSETILVEYSPFKMENFNNFDTKTIDQKYISEEFYSKYIDFDFNLFAQNSVERKFIPFGGNKVCFVTKILEKFLFDNFDATGGGFYTTPDLTSNSVTLNKSLNLITKINTTLPDRNFNYLKEDIFNDDIIKDKTVKIVSLKTNYRENKYQSLALQTLAFYLYNANNATKLLNDDSITKSQSQGSKYLDKLEKNFTFDVEIPTDLKIFGERFHYPVLASESMVSKDIDLTSSIASSLVVAEDFDIPEEVFLAFAEAEQLLNQIKNNFSQDYSIQKFGEQVQSSLISSIPCYGDILTLILEVVELVKSIRSEKSALDATFKIFALFEKFDIDELIRDLVAMLLKKLGLFEELKDSCKPPPAKFSINPDDLFSAYQYLLDLFFRSFNLVKTGIIDKIEEIPYFDKYAFFEKIGIFIIRKACEYGINLLVEIIRPYLEKACNFIDYDLEFFDTDTNDTAFLEPSIIGDNFGAPAGSGDAFNDVQLSIDINELIDLSGIADRQQVYSKFCDEFILQKSDTSFSEIAIFLTEISPSIDLYELASLLRGTATEATIKLLIDSVSFTTVSFKKLFSNDDEILSLFQFLAKFCDYKICYDILSKSLDKYVGNVCSPQGSRKKDYKLLVKELTGNDNNGNIRDVIIDLEKQLDSLCSVSFEINFDLFKDGPKLLPKAASQYMVMPFSTVIDFQSQLYTAELGEELKLQNSKLYDSLNETDVFFKDSSLDNVYLSNYITKQTEIKSFYNLVLHPQPLISSFSDSYQPRFNSWEKTREYVKKSQITKTKKILDRETELINYFTKAGIKNVNKAVNEKIMLEFFVDPISIAGKLYWEYLSGVFKNGAAFVLSDEKRATFNKCYRDVVYSTQYLEKLKDEISEAIENSTNLDLKDEPDLYLSYTRKLKQIFLNKV